MPNNRKVHYFLVSVDLELVGGKPAARGELDRLLAGALEEAVGPGVPFLAGPGETSEYDILRAEVERIPDAKAKWLAGEV